MNKFERLNEQLKLVVDEIRERFGAADISRFRLDIECDGETLSGEAKIGFRLGLNYSDGVESGDLEASIEECLRREQFRRRHQAIALPRPGARTRPNPDDEIPF